MNDVRPSRRQLLAGLSALALAPALVACGEDGGGQPAGAAPDPEKSEQGAFPVTLEHKYGSTTLEKAPARVVCVGLTEQDALLALGIVPVAVTKWFGDAPGYIFPWAVQLLGDAELPEVLEDTNGVEIEKVAALQPDLIIGQYAGLTKKDYELLSEIAPTVAQPEAYADYGAPWDEMAMNVAKAVGQPEKMQALVDEVKQQIADQAAAHPEFQGMTALVVTGYEGMFVYGPEDPRSRMLVDLGLHVPERCLRQRHGRVRRVAEHRAGLGPRQGRRRGLARLRVRSGGQEGLRADHHREGRSLVRHLGGRRRLLRRAQLRDAAEHPLRPRALRPAARRCRGR